MMNKNLSTKEKISQTHELEKKLLPRLKAMSYIFYVCSAISLSYAIFGPREAQEDHPVLFSNESTELYSGLPALTDETPFELDPKEVLNFYVISLLFTIGGSLILFIAWKKQKEFKL